MELNWREAEAVDARMELDLRIGAAFTRFQTLTFQQRFRELKDRIISYGDDLWRNVRALIGKQARD